MTDYKKNAKILGMTPIIKHRLEYLRGEILAEKISQSEIAELQSLAKHIDKGDILLLEWAGVQEQIEENDDGLDIFGAKA